MTTLHVDTNILIRLFTGEPDKQAQAVRAIFELADEEAVSLRLSPLIVAEAIYVLTSVYEQKRSAIAEAFWRVFGSPGITLAEDAILHQALRLFETTKLAFADAYLAASSMQTGEPVLSFDRDFDRVPGAQRVNPLTFKA